MKFSQYAAKASPTPADKLLIDDVADVSTASGMQKVITIAQLLALGPGTALTPSADATGAADTSAVNTALAAFGSAGGTVTLRPGTWYVNAPLVVPAGVRLAGQRADLDDTAAYGATLNCVAAWAQGGAPTAAAVIMNGNDSACDTLNINVNFIAVSLDGIGGSGSNVLLRDLCIYGGAIHGVNQGGLTWRGERIMANQCQFGFVPGSDSDYTDCIASAGQDGWVLNNAINTRLTACRAEWNSGYGYHVSGSGAATGGTSLIGCSTDRNAGDGLHADSTGTWPLLVSGMMFRRDGSSGGSTSAVSVTSACTSPVILDGITVFPGFNDDGSGTQSPVTGITIGAGATYVAVTNAIVHAVTTPVSGTITQARSVATRTGSWNSPSAVTMLPETLTAVPSVVTLTDAATITVSAAAGNDMRVTLGGNRTMGAPGSASDGQIIDFLVTQDGTGSRTLAWAPGAGGYSFGAGSAPVLSTSAGAVDIIGFKYDAAKSRWLYLGSALGF